MDLDPAVRTFLNTKPDSGDPALPIAARREIILRGSDLLFGTFGEPVAAAASEQDFTVGSGENAFRVRVYRPGDATGLPIHVFLHGGGFWLGSVDEKVNESVSVGGIIQRQLHDRRLRREIVQRDHATVAVGHLMGEHSGVVVLENRELAPPDLG